MRAYRRTSSIIASIIFAIIGIGMVIAAIVLATNEQKFISTATKVPGTVTSFVTDTDSKGKISYKPVVDFTTTDGRQFTYTSGISSSPAAYSVGETVDIYYDPANPQNVVIGGQTGLIYLIIGGMGALCALTSVGTLALRIIRGR